MSTLRLNVAELVKLRASHRHIGKLLSLDVKPEVKLVSTDYDLRMRGRLLLRGSYLTNGEEIIRKKFSHSLPLEVTLPADKVLDEDQLSIGVDDFKYELLSEAQIGISAVLVIDGLVDEPEVSRSKPLAVCDGEVVVTEQRLEQEKTDYSAEERLRLEESLRLMQEGMAAVCCNNQEFASCCSTRQHPDCENQEMQISYAEEMETRPALHQGANCSAGTREHPGQRLGQHNSSHSCCSYEECEEPRQLHVSFMPGPVMEERITSCCANEPEAVEEMPSCPVMHETRAEMPSCPVMQKRPEMPSRNMPASEEMTLCEDQMTADCLLEEVANETPSSLLNRLMQNKEESFTSLRMVVVQNDETPAELAYRCNTSIERILRAHDAECDRLHSGEVVQIRG